MEPITGEESIFRIEMKENLKKAQHYSDAYLLQEACAIIPVEDLKIKATLRLSELDEGENNITVEDCLIPELLHWFKSDFFSWMDSPKCCDQTAQRKGVGSPTADESIWEAGRVELYICTRCQRILRFPRYNHPRKLLETRKGRCGEWANCFTLLCCALNYNSRIVVDATDHAWTEVYLDSQQRWIHCDPCEDIFDKPLVYEHGWKKKLTYVMAYGPHDVQDVTWRYTSDFAECKRRRTRCREEFLLHCICSFRKEMFGSLDLRTKDCFNERIIRELADFLTPPKTEGDSYSGRLSGSLEWRLGRGEIGISTQSMYVFRLLPEEIKKQRFCIRYSCTSNRYIRGTGNHVQAEDWSDLAFSYDNVFRKVEHDWKVAYLARTEGSPLGMVSWKFDFTGSGCVVDRLKVHLQSSTFENGKVKWIFIPNSDGSNSQVWLPSEVCPKETQEFRGCTGFTLTAELTEGKDRNAWQHSQLFRQPLDCATFPFLVEIYFSSISEATT